MVKFDPQSMSFRYPITKNDNLNLPDVEHINLRHLKEVMGRTASLLEAASMGIAAGLDEMGSCVANKLI